MSTRGYKGKTLAILLNGQRIAAVRAKSVTYSRTPIDRSDEENTGWRYLDRKVDSQSIQISVEGVATENNYALLSNQWLGNTFSNVTVQHANGTIEEASDGAFLQSLTRSGEHEGYVAFEASFLLSGLIVREHEIPILTEIDPSSAIVYADGFVMTLTGENFVNGAVGLWGGAPRTTTFISSTQLTMIVPYTDLDEVGTVQISVRNPGPIESNSLPFDIEAVPYTVATFLENGTFSAPVELVDVLVVAGGGAGRNGSGGGGGAGGLKFFEAVAITPNEPVAVVVGAGGTEGGINGGSSSFGDISAAGGGGGGGAGSDAFEGNDGGSGGGGGWDTHNDTVAGQGIEGQGHDGGLAYPFPAPGRSGGGGGGAGGPGFNGTANGAGDGGVGLDLSWLYGTGVGANGWFAGGGAGGQRASGVPGSGGKGGGGNTGQAGLANTGGGGGAGGSGNLGSAGGSGIVIVGYGSRRPGLSIDEASPSTVYAGLINNVAIFGSGFASNATARVGTEVLTTTFISSTELHISVTPDEAGTLDVVVVNPGPGGDFGTIQLTVEDPNPVPTITSIEPSRIAPGSSEFTLTIHGTGFVEDSVVRWNGAARATTFVDATELKAVILPGDVAQPGQATVTVFNPSPGGGESNAETFTITTYAATVLADNPVGYWRLGESEGTTAADSSGNDHHGAYEGDPTLGVTGLIDDPDLAVELGGDGDYVEIPSHSDFDIGSSLAIEMWFRYEEGAAEFARMLSRMQNANNGVNIALDPGNQASAAVVVRFRRGGTNHFRIVNHTFQRGNRYHLFAAIDEENNVIAFVNGASASLTTGGGGSVQGTTALRIGYSSGDNYFAGVVDEVAWYDYVPTPERVAAHYQAGIGTPSP